VNTVAALGHVGFEAALKIAVAETRELFKERDAQTNFQTPAETQQAGCNWNFEEQKSRRKRNGGGEELAALSGISVARVRIVTFALAGVFYAIGGILAAAQLGLGNAQIGNGRLFTTVTAVVVGGTSLSGGQGGVLQTFVGVLIVSVLSNGMVLMGVPPSVQIGFQGLMIIGAVALSIDRERMRIVK